MRAIRVISAQDRICLDYFCRIGVNRRFSVYQKATMHVKIAELQPDGSNFGNKAQPFSGSFFLPR